jgi:hypothetical protein
MKMLGLASIVMKVLTIVTKKSSLPKEVGLIANI